VTDDDAYAAVLKALATPEVLQILDYLLREGACDVDDVRRLGLSPHRTRSTLAGLVQAGVVTCSPLPGGVEAYRLSEPVAVERLLSAARRLSDRTEGPWTTSASTRDDKPGKTIL
jgi:DNA-binding transcriptional ArsR family regulator